MVDVTLGLAFFAGIVSFISPCVLPLVPAYIGYMGGRMTNNVAAQMQMGAGGAAVATRPTLSMRFNTLMHGLMFVFGFTLVFVLLGVITTAFIQQVGGQNVNLITGILGRVGGIVIILLGLHFMGVLPSLFAWMRRPRSDALNLALVIGLTLFGLVLIAWGFTGRVDLWNETLWRGRDGGVAPTVWAPILSILLMAGLITWLFIAQAFTAPRDFLNRTTSRLDALMYADTRRQMDAGSGGLLSSLFMGVVFSAGWTPCIGPIYGAILTMSATTGDVTQAVPLLTAYSLGLGIPFLLAALLLDGAAGFVRKLNRRMRTIKLVSGVFLVLIGLLIASGQLQTLSQQLGAQFTDFSIRVEECSVGWAQGDITFGQLGDCLGGGTSIDALRELNGTAALPVDRISA